MARTGRPPEVADTAEYDAALALQKRTATELTTAQTSLVELEARLATAALDDPGNFDKLADGVAAAKKGVRRLELAAREAEKRAEAALLTMRRTNEQLRVKRALRQLAERDRLGGEIEVLLKQVGERYREMVTATGKARTMLSGLLDGKESLIGYGLGVGELERLVAIELWRADSTLPGAERPIKLDGTPGGYIGASDTPGMRASLEGCTEFVRGVVMGERTYAGHVLVEPPAPPPEPKKKSLFGRLLNRKADDAPADVAAREEATAPADTSPADEGVASDFNNAVGADNARVANEPFEQWLERVTRPEPLSDEEREALHAPPAGPTRSAAEIQAEMNALRPPMKTLIDHRANPNQEDW